MVYHPWGQTTSRAKPSFDLCIHGQPISAQTKHRGRLVAWKHEVRSACQLGQPLTCGPVYLRITYYGERRGLDLDNLVKPIQDAMEGVVFRNDRQVVNIEGRYANINGRFEARFMSAALAAAFVNGAPFIHIEVWYHPENQDFP